MGHGRRCADRGGDGVAHAVAGFHGVPGRRGHLLIRFNPRGGGHGGGIVVPEEIIPALIHPISIIIAGAVPHPIRVPLCPPHAPCGVGLFLPAGDAAGPPASCGVGGLRVRRVVAGKINHFCLDGSLAQSPPICAHRDGNILRFGRGMPLHPRKLTVPLWDDDIAHAVGAALDGKGHSGGAIRVNLRTGIERHRRYHIGVYPVFVVIVGRFRLLRGLFLKSDNTHTQVGDDGVIGTGLVRGAGIGRKAQIRIFKVHRQREIFMGQARHGPAQGAARLVVVEGRFMGSHGVHNTIVLEVGDWLQKQFILSCYQIIIRNTRKFCDITDNDFITKIFLDCFNTRLAAAGADDPRHCNRRIVINIAACCRRDRASIPILDF